MKKVLFSGLLAFLCLSSFAQNKEDNTIYTTMDQPAQYAGGFKEFYKFIDSNINYSNLPTQKGFKNPELKFFIKIVIEKDGLVSDAVASKDMHEKFLKEFKRVALLSPKWKSAMQNNKPIRSYITIPIKLDLEKF